MTHVSVKNGNVDGALRIFKQKFAKSGVPSEIKKRKHYDKPGVKRRTAKEECIKNCRSNRKNRD